MLRRLSLRHPRLDEEVLDYKNRLELIEKHFEEVSEAIEKYAKTTEKLGHKGETLSRAIFESFQDLDPDMVVFAKKFTKHFTIIQWNREELASQLSDPIASGFRVYGTKCRETKIEVKDYNRLLVKEQKEKAELLHVRSIFPTNTRKITEAKVRLEKAEITTRNAGKLLRKQMKDLEKEKLKDRVKILLELVRLEMQFHARALQIYTSGYKELMAIQETEDDSVCDISDEKNDESNSTL